MLAKKPLTKNIKPCEDGFALVELLVVMIVMAVVLTIIFEIFLSFTQANAQNNQYITEEGHLYSAIYQLNTEAREALNPASAPGTTYVLLSGSSPTTLAFYITAQDGTQTPIKWSFLPVSGKFGPYVLGRSAGTGLVGAITWPPNPTYQLTNIISGQFCYVNQSGVSMTGQNGCPGTKAAPGTFSSNQIDACAVEVYVEIETLGQVGVRPLFASIGVGLRNQNAELVSQQAIGPQGPAAC